MSDKVKVSIIIPVYNVERYLVKCLNSLKNQTLKEIEIICVNDGSTDGSAKILNTFSKYDSRIIVINQENQGLSIARNTGMKIAKGEYIGFVDSDDWVDRDFYEKLYNAAKKSNCEIAAGDFYRQGKILRTQRLKYKKTEAFFDPAKKIEKAFIPQHNYVWNKIYKREALLKQDYEFPAGMYYEDMIWSVKIVYNLDGFVTVPNTFYHYRKNEGSVVTQKTEKHKQDALKAEKILYSFLETHNLPINIRYKFGQKDQIKIFGLKLMKAEYYYPSTIKYKLFGFINILEVNKFEKFNLNENVSQ